jgi:hypothetical protein
VNSVATLVIVLILAVALLTANALIAAVFLRGRKGGFRGMHSRDDEAIHELHRRVERLLRKKD